MMYGERRFMHFWVDILIVLYIFGFGTARLGEWRLNHIHSINGAEDINASCSGSSAEIEYSRDRAEFSTRFYFSVYATISLEPRASCCLCRGQLPGILLSNAVYLGHRQPCVHNFLRYLFV